MSLKILLQNTFSLSTLIIFLISAIVLIFIDCKDFKKKGFGREYKTAKAFGVFFLVSGIGMYVVMRFIVS